MRSGRRAVTFASILLPVAPALGLLPAQDEADLRALAQTVFSGDRAGVVLVTRGDREVLAMPFGRQGPHGAPVAMRTLFDIGGLSETFTAAVALRLAQDGKWSLEDPVAGLLRHAPASWRAMTLRHLLRHESGLPESVELSKDQRERRLGLLACLTELQPDPAPGRRFRDTPLDSVLLAALIEQVTGGTFEDCVRELAFGPAGLRDTGFVGDGALDRRRALMRYEPGVDAAPNGDATQGVRDWSIRGAGGIVSTAHDVRRWYCALRDGSVLDALHEREYRAVDRWRRASGFEVELAAETPTWIGRAARAHGFRSLLRHHVGTDLLVVALGGAGADLDNLDRRIRALVAGDGHGAAFERLVGCYRVKTGEELEVAIAGEQLVLRATGQELASRLRHGQPQMPEWPRFYDEVRERAEVLLRPLLERDAQSFARSFHAEAPADAAASALALVADLEARHGKLGQVRLVGSSAAVGLATWFRLWFGATPVTLVVEWHGEKLHRVRRSEVEHPFEVALEHLRDFEFAAPSLDGTAQLVVIFRADGKGLELKDRSKAPVRAVRMR